MRGEAIDPDAVKAAIAGLFTALGGNRIDTVVLACTHFPLLEAELAAAAPHPVTFVDGSAGIARRIAHLTAGQAWPTTAPVGVAVFTRVDDAVRALGPALTARGFGEIVVL